LAAHPMQATVSILGKPVHMELSKAAETALAARSVPLRVDMELRFSCMVRKQVRFEEGRREGDIDALDGKLALSFRPVTARACTLEASLDQPPLPEGYPVARPEKAVPKWLRIDFRRGRWTGEFGYSAR
jgi:hypothetical protein